MFTLGEIRFTLGDSRIARGVLGLCGSGEGALNYG